MKIKIKTKNNLIKEIRIKIKYYFLLFEIFTQIKSLKRFNFPDLQQWRTKSDATGISFQRRTLRDWIRILVETNARNGKQL